MAGRDRLVARARISLDVAEGPAWLALPTLAGVALLALSGVFSSAVSQGAQGTPEQREACTPDVYRLCSAEIPDVDRIVACMKKNQASLSNTCRAALTVKEASRGRRAR